VCFVQSITDINQYLPYTSLLFDHKTIAWGKRSPGVKQRMWQCADWLVLSKTSDRNYVSLSTREVMIISKTIPKELLQKRLFSATWSTKNIGVKSPRNEAQVPRQEGKQRLNVRSLSEPGGSDEAVRVVTHFIWTRVKLVQLAESRLKRYLLNASSASVIMQSIQCAV
jgi:hypothetical protein